MCSTHTEAILEWLKGSMWTSFLDVLFLIPSPLPRIGCHRPQIDQMSSDELVNRTWKSSKRSSFLQLECTSLWRASLLLQLNEYILRRVCCSIPCMCLDSHIRNWTICFCWGKLGISIIEYSYFCFRLKGWMVWMVDLHDKGLVELPNTKWDEVSLMGWVAERLVFHQIFTILALFFPFLSTALELRLALSLILSTQPL